MELSDIQKIVIGAVIGALSVGIGLTFSSTQNTLVTNIVHTFLPAITGTTLIYIASQSQ